MEPLVRFEHVSKKYLLGLSRTSLPALVRAQVKGAWTGRSNGSRTQALWAVKDVSFELSPGESMALVGPNGAGKSTILKLLSRITLPTAGLVRANGRLSALLELGAGFHPDLTGRENIYLNGTILGLTRQEVTRRFDRIVAFSELEGFIDTPVKRYSSGMQVRLGFSVAACMEPEILLVDEVLAVGDASFRERCLQRIQSLIAAGTSVIFVSHNLYMVQAVCRRALYMRRGQVQYLGDALQAIAAYERDIHVERAQKFEPAAATVAGLPGESGPPLDITSVVVASGKDGEPGAIDSDGPARVSIHYNAYDDITGINLTVFLRRSDGIACAMVRSKLDDFTLRLPRGRGVIALDFDPLQLATGSYFAEVEIVDEADTTVLRPDKARSAWFLVKSRSRSYDTRFSPVFEPFATWSGPHDLVEQP